MANGIATTNRLIAGQSTLLARTMHDIRYDAIHDEMVVPNQFGQTILTFRGGANGEEAPIRFIQGPRTQMKEPDRLDIDPVHNEIFVPNIDSILVFSRDSNGDVAPMRIIRGPRTRLRGVGSIAVDPVHDVIVVPSRMAESRDLSLLIFNRTDEGDVAPRAIIGGPQTGLYAVAQMGIYPPRGHIVVTQVTNQQETEPKGIFVGVWSIRDQGDVPPRWKIGGPKSTLKKPRGVAFNPKNKELIVADMRLNSVLTYYFPEIF